MLILKELKILQKNRKIIVTCIGRKTLPTVKKVEKHEADLYAPKLKQDRDQGYVFVYSDPDAF
jgi:hypothetical protein